MKKLKNKSILLIAPSFLRYDEEIKACLEKMGATVVMYDERPTTIGLYKVFNRLKPQLLEPINQRYFQKIIERNKHKDYDFVFVIKGEALSCKSLTRLKSAFAKSVFVNYIWDSLSNVNGAKAKLELFDRCYSFDYIDCSRTLNLHYKPLFYINKYSPSTAKPANSSVQSAVFVGSLHSDRYWVVKSICDELKQRKEDIETFTYFYFSSSFIFRILKIFLTTFRNIPFKEVHFSPLDAEENALKTQAADVVIDVAHPGQSGLTLRTIETVAMSKKLITTNPSVMNEEFYNSKNICVVDRKNPTIPREFLQNSYVPLKPSLIEDFNLENWLIAVLGRPRNINPNQN